MEIFQRTSNPWGQDILIGISWDLFYVALAAGALFCIVHLVLRPRWRRKESAAAKEPAGFASGGTAGTTARIPEKVVRHGLTARLFHGVMAVAMIVLLLTGFLPKVGIQFASWLTLHWVFGVVLIASIVFHMIHATFFLRLRDVWIGPRDVREWFQEMRHLLGGGPPPPKPGKYPVDHKLYHHAVTVAGFAAMITGVVMMFRIEQPFFARNPYLYSDSTWGWIYVLHGVGGVLLVTLTITHVYFALLPEKRWITRSMIKGWITRRELLVNHDPERWEVAGEGERGETPTAEPARESA
ncbi:MAG TPA: cytochrome b/b6 domain-containing protein [Thermoanaerobaculia bacterium]|nr:cytochrome b/b6 domain-containing protein [Thermoanaerobaculia bacterium]